MNYRTRVGIYTQGRWRGQRRFSGRSGSGRATAPVVLIDVLKSPVVSRCRINIHFRLLKVSLRISGLPDRKVQLNMMEGSWTRSIYSEIQ